MWLRLFSIRLYLALDRTWRKANRMVFFWRSGRGAEVFLERYRGDQVVAVGSEERRRATDFEKCQTCSLCTFSCTAIAKAEAPPSFEPKQMISVFGKYTHETELFQDEWFPCVRCDACTVVCPNEVPLHEWVNQILSRRNRQGYRRGTHRDRH